MTFRWLGLNGNLGAEVALRGGSLYRGRVAYTSPLGCQDATTLSAVRQAILSIARTPQFPVDLQVYTTESALPADWPADRRTSTAGLGPGECLLFWEGRASSDVVADDSLFAGQLPPLVAMFGVSIRSIDLWQQPPAGGAPGIPQPPCPDGTAFDATQNRCVPAPRPECPAGTAWNQDFGVCVPAIQPCGPGQIWWFYEALVDQPGGGGKCVPAICPGGTERNPSTGECVAPAAIGPGTCPEGFDFDSATELCIEREPAVAPSPVGECPPSAHRDQFGNCVCDLGYEPIAGSCVPVAAAPASAPAPSPARKSSSSAFVVGALALAVVGLAALAGRPGA
jgi:hypothetical protein